MEGWRTHFKLEVSEEANSELKIQVILIPFLFTCYTYFPLPWPCTPYVMFSLLQERIDEHFWRILDQRTHTYGFIMKTKIKGWQLNNSYYNVVTDTSIWNQAEEKKCFSSQTQFLQVLQSDLDHSKVANTDL